MARFDVALHLIGEQNIPNYIAIKHLDAEKHILLATDKTKRVAQRLKASLIEYGARIVIEPIGNAFQLGELINQFTVLRQQFDEKQVALNVTGGTKLMAIALLHAFNEMKGCESFYVEAHDQNALISITKNKVLPLEPCFEDAKTFVSLQSPELLSRYKDRRPSEAELAVACELRKFAVGKLNADAFFFAEMVKKYRWNKLGKENYAEITKKVDSLKKKYFKEEEKRTDIETLENELGQEAFWRFLAGRWFEVYTYNLFQKFSDVSKQKVRGLRLSVPIFYENKEVKRQERQELDLAYTDGFAFYVIECKARREITQDDVQKLENNVWRYGGTFGRGVLVSAYQQQDAILDRIETSPNVMLVHGDDVECLEAALLNWHPGVWQQ